MDDTLDIRSGDNEAIQSLFKSCLDLFVGLWKTAKKSDIFSEDQTRSLYILLERFFLWGDGFDVTKGTIDVILARSSSSSLRNLILQLLSAVGHTLIDRFVAFVEPDLVEEMKIPDHVVALMKVLGDGYLLDQGSDGLYHTQSEDSDSEGSDADDLGDEIAEIIASLATYIDCLCDSIPSIEQLAAENLRQSETNDIVEQVLNDPVQAQSTPFSSISAISEPSIAAKGVGIRRQNYTATLTSPKARAEEKNFQANKTGLIKAGDDAKDIRPQKQMGPSLTMTSRGEGSISGVGELMVITKLAYAVYAKVVVVARDAPQQFQDLCEDLRSLQNALYQISKEAQRVSKIFLGTTVEVILDQCLKTLRELETMVTKYERLGGGSGGRAAFWRLLWAHEQEAIVNLCRELKEQLQLLGPLLLASESGTEVVHRVDPRSASPEEPKSDMSHSATSDTKADSVPALWQSRVATLGPVADILRHREKFRTHTKVQGAFKRLFETEEEYSPDFWLRTAVWWLVKSRTITTLLNSDRNRIMGASNTQVPWDKHVSAEQAFTDLLKSSWIFEEVILDGVESEHLAHSYGEIMEIAEALSSDLHEFEATFETHIMLDHDLALSESFELPTEAENNIPNALDGLPKSSRWFRVDADKAGRMHERLLYRTFVNARLGPKTKCARSSRAPYMLLLWVMTGDNDLFISLCNLQGTVDLWRKVIPKDLDTIPFGKQVAFVSPIEIAFPSQESEITFLSEQDMIRFWTLPRDFFAAIKDSYPVERELTIYKSPIVFYVGKMDLKSPWAVADATPNYIQGGELRVHESMLYKCWTTTRRLVVNSPPYAAKHVCVSHWLPLDHVSVLVEGITVTVSWSDCGQPETTTTSNFSPVSSYIHKSREPNQSIQLKFESTLQAQTFEDCLLFPSELTPQIKLKLERELIGQHVRIYQLFDANEAEEYYSAITSTKKSKSGYRTTEIFFVFRDVDWYFTTQNNTPLVIDFSNLVTPMYVSTRPLVHRELQARDVVFKEVIMRQRSAHLEFSSHHDLVGFMRTLTGWRLTFFRIVPKLFLGTFWILSAKLQQRNIQLQVWEKRVEEGLSSTQLCIRLKEDTRDRWITASFSGVPQTSYSVQSSKHTVQLRRLRIHQGTKVDMKTMVASTRGVQAHSTSEKQRTMTLAFRSISDCDDFLSSSGFRNT